MSRALALPALLPSAAPAAPESVSVVFSAVVSALVLLESLDELPQAASAKAARSRANATVSFFMGSLSRGGLA